MIKTEYARKIFSFTGAKEYNMLPLEAHEMAATDFITFLKKHFSSNVRTHSLLLLFINTFLYCFTLGFMFHVALFNLCWTHVDNSFS